MRTNVENLEVILECRDGDMNFAAGLHDDLNTFWFRGDLISIVRQTHI